MMFPTDTSFAEEERIPVFHSVHPVHDRMTDLRLQLTCRAAKDLYSDNRHESGLLKLPDMTADRREVMVDAGKAEVRS